MSAIPADTSGGAASSAIPADVAGESVHRAFHPVQCIGMVCTSTELGIYTTSLPLLGPWLIFMRMDEHVNFSFLVLMRMDGHVNFSFPRAVACCYY